MNAGYDENGKYRLTADCDREPQIAQTGDERDADAHDQCPECRCAPGQPHAPDCGQNPARVPHDLWGTRGVRDSQTGDVPEQEAGIFTESPSSAHGENAAEGEDAVCEPTAQLWREHSNVVRTHTASDDPVNIPLEIQERLFECEYAGIVRQLAMWLDECDGPDGAEFDAELRCLALSRLRSGYETYGSDAFTWSPERRRREFLEEIADSICYLVTGPIE